LIDFKQGLEQQVQLALTEDIGSGDITAGLISQDTQASASVITREAAILCGVDWFNETFLQLNPDTEINWSAGDGDAIETGQTLCRVKGNARSLLTAERTALNFLQTLSATATRANQYARCIDDLPSRVLDTRKTIPGLRLAQKYAVHCGGCSNHRIGLFDMVLIKENHILAAGSIKNAVLAAKKIAHKTFIEVEVESLEQLSEALESDVDRVLLDNMDINTLEKAVALNKQGVELEASGGVTIKNIRQIALTGVDFISTGALTKDIQAIDLSMRLQINDA